MPIKAKPINPQRAAEAAKGRLSSAGAAYAERQARAREQQRRWAAEEEEEARLDGGDDDDDEDSGDGVPRQGPSSLTPRGSKEAGRNANAAGHADDDSEEEALLAAAQERTRRFLSAGNDVMCGEEAGPSLSVRRLVAYEAAKRRDAMRARKTESEADSEGPAQRAEDKPATTKSAALARPPVGTGTLPLGVDVKDPPGVAEARSPVSTRHAKPTANGITATTRVSKEVAEEARQPATHADPLQQDFEKLMHLFADDVRKEREGTSPSPSVAAGEDTLPGRSDSPKSPRRQSSAGYRPPPRTFTQLQSDTLQGLYEEWSSSHGGGSRNAPAEVFVASDYEAKAFAIAATAASSVPSRATQSATTPFTRSLLVADAPLSLEELAATETALRNAAVRTSTAGHGADNSVGTPPNGHAVVVCSARVIAETAQDKLSRFLQAVAWTERLVRDAVFVATVAAFLYENHKVFLPHCTKGPVSPDGRQRASAARGEASQCGADPVDEGDERVGEHSHDEFAVYEQFAQRASDALLRVLSAQVAGFDEEEFIEALFDSPADAYVGETGAGGGAAPPVPGPQNVLSYPAWRIILSMSSFESFFAWMMDYIQEEYHLGRDPLREEAVVAVGGTRGLRALIQSTYHRGTSQPPGRATLTSPQEESVQHDEDWEGQDRDKQGPTREPDVAARVPARPTSSPLACLPLGGGTLPVHGSAAAAVAATDTAPAVTTTALAGASSWSGSLSDDELNRAAPGSLPTAMERQSLALLRQGKRLYPTPPSSATSEGSLLLRPRNSHLGAAAGKGKKPTATATRDLPPLTNTPPPASPLGDSAFAVMTSASLQDRRPSSQPTVTQEAASASAPKPSQPTRRSARRQSAGMDRGGSSSHSPGTRLPTRSASRTKPPSSRSGSSAPVKKSGAVKPKLKRAA